jgi:two-component system sensor histidine kinase SenX3
MSYTFAIVTFLVGAALGVSVARRRVLATRTDSSQPAAGSTQRIADLRETGESASLGVAEGVLGAALNSLPSGVVISDASGVVLFKNKAAQGISGIRHIDVLVDEALLALLKDTAGSQTEYRRFDTAGTPTRSFDLRTQRLADGKLVGTIEDVTEQARIDTVRTDFVANLSHELKTPIGGIAALADTMIGETDPQVIERLTSRIVEESYRLSRIVDDLLDLSRIEFGGADDWEPVGVSEVVREVVARLQHESMRMGVSIEVQDSVHVQVLGDRMQLVSALENLVTNAMKYSGDGKKVLVEVHATEEVVSLAVTDQGIGIAAKDHQRIFERFFRVDRARSRNTGGVGLGLSIVRHVVSNHGGTVSVVSEEGRGSTFTIVLPRVATTALGNLPNESVDAGKVSV